MSRSIGDLGEFVLIDQVTTRLRQGSEILLGPGDDAAIVAAPDGRVVATTDLLVEDRHFRRDWSGPYDLGRKAAAQNLADVAAMGGRPTALLVGLAAPPELEVDWVLELTDGLRDECDVAGASVAGGDISAADRITLCVTALGDLGGRAPVTRAGARPGDLVLLAGRVGWAAAGLALLRWASARSQSVPDRLAPLVAAHRRPVPPYGLGPAFASAGAHAMCDVSDGLVQDLGHIATASGVCIDLSRAGWEVPALLSDAAALIGDDPWAWLLGGGDDHPLVACLPAGTAPAAGQVIGRVAEGGGSGIVRVDGARWDGDAGHDHFSRHGAMPPGLPPRLPPR
jgi:thiamine-monophosphate kinase